jgi:hypothetical protein
MASLRSGVLLLAEGYAGSYENMHADKLGMFEQEEKTVQGRPTYKKLRKKEFHRF